MTVNESMGNELLWTPSPERVRDATMTRFMRAIEERHGVEIADYAALHQWSIDNVEDFWRAMWSFCGVVGDGPGERTVVDRDAMPGARYFPDAKICFAENLLKHSLSLSSPDNEGDALVFRGKDRVERRLSHRMLLECVSQAQQAFVAAGIEAGDRICAVLPNMPEAVIGMLAASSLGAMWSSCSPDFGAQGIVDRFGQIEPKMLITCDGYYYNGKTLPILDKIAEVKERIPSIECLVIVSYVAAGSPSKVRTNGMRFSQRTRRRCRRFFARPSITRCTSSFPAARRASRSASCTGRVASCCST